MFYTTTSSNIISQQVEDEAEEREVIRVESLIQSKIIHKASSTRHACQETIRLIRNMHEPFNCLLHLVLLVHVRVRGAQGDVTQVQLGGAAAAASHV